MEDSIRLLKIMQERKKFQYASIIAEVEFWFASNIDFDFMFARSRNEVTL
jgi:hypothetical protein